jgi:hypothetical protein
MINVDVLCAVKDFGRNAGGDFAGYERITELEDYKT